MPQGEWWYTHYRVKNRPLYTLGFQRKFWSCQWGMHLSNMMQIHAFPSLPLSTKMPTSSIFFFLTKVVQFLLTPCKSTAVVAVVKLDHNWISMDIQFMIGLIYFTFVLMSAVLADTLQFKKIQVIKNWLDRLMQHQYTWRVQRAEAGKAPVHHGTKYQNFADTKKYTGRDICHFLNHHPVCAGLQHARVEARAAMRGCTSLPAQWS